MERPIQLLLLRAYGDFLIALHLAAKNQLKVPIRLIASAHLEPLFKALPINLPHDLSIEFHPFLIRNNLFGYFTDRYLFSLGSFHELLALKKFIKANQTSEPFYLEQKKRSSLLRFFCAHPFKYIIEDQNVYESYARFFKADLAGLSNIHWPIELAQKKVLLLPDARQSKRKIAPELIQLIQLGVESKKANLTIASFSVHYNNFNELVSIIQEHDIIIGSDSMPIHLAQLLGKPHCINRKSVV